MILLFIGLVLVRDSSALSNECASSQRHNGDWMSPAPGHRHPALSYLTRPSQAHYDFPGIEKALAQEAQAIQGSVYGMLLHGDFVAGPVLFPLF